MAKARKETISKLQEAGWEAYGAGLCLKAAGFFREARRLAAERGEEGARVTCLFWEAESLRSAGDEDAALPLLLEAAAARRPEVDPVDVFHATTAVIDISVSRKSAAFVRRLLADAWRELERLGKESWGHKLGLLEGSLELWRGEFQLGVVAAEKAWAAYKDAPPSYPRAAHLRLRCYLAFRLRDGESLLTAAEEMETNQTKGEMERIDTLQGRALLLRSGERHEEHLASLAELARSGLRRLESMERAELRHKDVFLRSLALAGHASEAEAHLTQAPVNERFSVRLLRGDLCLSRARQRLGLRPRDDEWDQEYPPPHPPFPDREAGLRALEEAEELFRGATALAASEDERLETTYYTRTLEGRLARVRAYREAVEGVP